jgi:hypothetical protein
MSQWKLVQPEWNKLIQVNLTVLILEHFTKSSDSIVFGMMELRLLALFLFDASIHWILNSSLETVEAQISQRSECLTSVLSNHSDSVN